jgi:hypothetical protein
MNYKIPLTAFFVVYCLGGSQAQMMIPTTTTIGTPYGNVTSTSYNYMSTGNGFGSYSYMKLPRNIVRPASIILVNDSTLRGDYNFNGEQHIHTMTLESTKNKDAELQFTPPETKEIRISFPSRYVIGIPLDSVWLFNIVSGKMNGYARLPYEKEDYKAIRFISKGDGPIEKLSKESLMKMVADNPKAMQFVMNRKLAKAIKVYNR